MIPSGNNWGGLDMRSKFDTVSLLIMFNRRVISLSKDTVRLIVLFGISSTVGIAYH